MRLPAYAHYKPSGIEWLGDVPEHWDVNRLKWTTTGMINGIWGEEPNGVDDMICVRVADFDRDRFLVVDEPPTLRAVDEAQRERRLLRKGDLLIEKSGGGEKQLVGCVVFFDHDFTAVCSNFVARMPTSPRHIPRFWSYAHASLYAGRLNYPAVKQTTGIQNLDSAAYLDTRVALPPDEEQRAIADFLDREAAKIDTLVAKKWTLIERLKEKRTALISRTVTRGLPSDVARAAGLDSHPKLKPSGIEWLGKMPDHWEVKKLGHISTVVRGASPRPAGDPRYFDGDFIPWVTVGELTKDSGRYLTSTESMLTQEGAALSRVMREGTLVLTNSGATLGVPKILAITGCANDGVVAFENLRRDANILFLYYFLASITENLRDRIKQGSGQPNLNTDIIRALAGPFPPATEQRAIVDYLVGETAKIDAMVAKVETAIDRLQEYRTALITAAVTGKIDVRSERADNKAVSP